MELLNGDPSSLLSGTDYEALQAKKKTQIEAVVGTPTNVFDKSVQIEGSMLTSTQHQILQARRNVDQVWMSDKEMGNSGFMPRQAL